MVFGLVAVNLYFSPPFFVHIARTPVQSQYKLTLTHSPVQQREAFALFLLLVSFFPVTDYPHRFGRVDLYIFQGLAPPLSVLAPRLKSYLRKRSG